MLIKSVKNVLLIFKYDKLYKIVKILISNNECIKTFYNRKGYS